MKKARQMINRVFKITRLEEMRILPGHLAFFMVLSVFAIFPIFSYISSSFINNELISSMEHTLPVGVTTILKALMETKSSDFGTILFLLLSIFIASNGCDAMIITSDVLYKIKEANIIKQRVKAYFMTIILITLIIFIVVVPAFGDVIINTIAKSYPGKVIDTISYGYQLLKYPISFLLIFIDIKILYTLAPSRKISSHYNNYGTLFTTILWILVTRIYAIYLNHFNTYNIFYGSFGNVVIMLFWVYLLAYIFTMGMALNRETYLSSQKDVN